MRNSRALIYSTMALGVLVFLSGCISYTRTEKDIYTLTNVDTVITETVKNQPGDRDNGIIYPSSRTVVIDRYMTQQDSVVIREYPSFIRLGLFEGVGLIGTDLGGGSTQTGLFGVFYDIDRLLTADGAAANSGSNLFSGYIYRFGIAEWRLRWLDDASNWTVGFNALEIIRPDNSQDFTLTGYGAFTLHKRFYFRDKIPYFCITPQVSMAIFPSVYVNPSVSADLGSIGGLNLRVYAGYALGVTSWTGGNGVNFPYVGVGASVLDFLNREEELEVEWKNHEHSAWHLDIADLNIVGANTAFSMFGSKNSDKPQPLISGLVGRVASVELALPILNNRFTIGTSLLNVMFLGVQEFGIGVLPIRVGYFWNPFPNRFAIQPFVEYNYAPSQIFHTGVRAYLPISENTSLQFVAGYTTGSIGSETLRVIGQTAGVPGIQSFSALYVGLGVSIFDRLFGSNELRYGRGLPHE